MTLSRFTEGLPRLYRLPEAGALEWRRRLFIACLRCGEAARRRLEARCLVVIEPSYGGVVRAK